ncbi:hypothetical protein FXO37_32057 [Capsicum annuum]|nr:hypothetical protein FXO37_32057 [Capsicum annuum]
MRYFKNTGSLLLFPSLITELCRRAGVEEYPHDTWVWSKTLIYSLKSRVEDAPGKTKKRKIDLGKSIHKDIDSCRPSTSSPFEEISIEIRAIRELVSGCPLGPRVSSTAGHSYVAQTNYERFLADQMEKGASISRLERSYSTLAQLHKELK